MRNLHTLYVFVLLVVAVILVAIYKMDFQVTNGILHNRNTSTLELKNSMVLTLANVGTNNQPTLGTKTHGTVEVNNQPTLRTKTQGTVETNNQPTLGTQTRGAIQANNQPTLGIKTTRIIEVNNQPTLGTKTQGTVEANNQPTLGTQTRGTIQANNQPTLRTQTRGTIQTNNKPTLGIKTTRTVGVNNQPTLGTKTWAIVGVKNQQPTPRAKIVPRQQTLLTEKKSEDEWTSTIILKTEEECPDVVKEESPKNNSITCRIPELDPFHPSIMQFIRDTPYPNCPGTTYGVLQDGTLNFTDPNVVSASYQPILRDGDFKYKLGASVSVGQNKITDELMEVNFKLKNGRSVQDFLFQVLPKKELLEREGSKKPGIPINILTIGLDSLSYGNTRRKLPKLYEFLKDDLKALFYKGHTVVGDGTTPQLTAMLTGKHVEEQYEARTGMANARPIDGWTWIFKELKENGYLTGFSEDGVWDGPFQYRLKGFSLPPTDFYPRPYFLDVAIRTKYLTDRCINNRNIAKIHLEYVRCVFDAFPKKLKFFVSFSAGFSHHEINHVKKNERDVLALLKDFKAKGYLENTLLIVMGDHGLRYGAVRQKVQGKLEERLPLYSMAVPSWFPSRYPDVFKIMQTNTARLTSWFDVHATFQHILNFPTPPADMSRGISLFTEIPATRTCKDAGIANHWCPCLEWSTVDVKHSQIKNAALAAVEFMNHLLASEQESSVSCANLSLKTVNFAQLERPNAEVVKTHLKAGARFKQSEEYFCRYQLQFVTSPNEGVFEATVKYHKNRFIVNTSISRINKYGDQPKCVAAKLPHVRKFCLCKDYKGPL